MKHLARALLEILDLLKWFGFPVVMTASGYCCALWLWDLGRFVAGDTQWVRVILGPLSAAAGIAGIFLPAVIVVAVGKLFGKA